MCPGFVYISVSRGGLVVPWFCFVSRGELFVYWLGQLGVGGDLVTHVRTCVLQI